MPGHALRLLVAVTLTAAIHNLRAGSVLQLDGTGQAAIAPTTVFPVSGELKSFTVEAWIYPRLNPLIAFNGLIAANGAFELFWVFDSSNNRPTFV